MSEEGQGPREAGAEATTERVAAILAADAVGYTRLMADDEKGTLAALDRARAVFREHVAANRGRVVDTVGLRYAAFPCALDGSGLAEAR